MEEGRSVSLSRSAARMKVDKLRRRIGELTRELQSVDRSAKAVVALVIDLHEGQAHRALGYRSWADLVKAEGLQVLHLGPDESTAAIRDMVASNFSTGGVSAVLGLSSTTGKRRVKKFIESQEGQGAIPEMVRSLDGIVRPRAKKPPLDHEKDQADGQQVLDLFPSDGAPLDDNASLDVDGFLSAIGASSNIDETAEQIVMIEAISQDLKIALDSLVSVEPEKRHASRVRELLHHTEAIVDQRRMVASRWGISV